MDKMMKKEFCSIIEIEKEYYPNTYRKRVENITDQYNIESHMAEKTLEKVKKEMSLIKVS